MILNRFAEGRECASLQLDVIIGGHKIRNTMLPMSKTETGPCPCWMSCGTAFPACA
jgi:hypothetical protein